MELTGPIFVNIGMAAGAARLKELQRQRCPRERQDVDGVTTHGYSLRLFRLWGARPLSTGFQICEKNWVQNLGLAAV